MGEVTNFPFGLSSFGTVLGGGQSGLSIPRNNGQAWFVDTLTGSDGGSGLSPSDPLKTIARAHSLAGNGTGDTIYVAPGEYDETLIITKDYIGLVGMVQAGYAKPDIGPKLTTQIPLTVKGQGFLARHLRIFGDAADVVSQGGNGFLYEDCVFDGDATANKAGVRLLPVAVTVGDTHHTASEGQITGCLFRGCAVGLIFDDAAAPLGVGSIDNLIGPGNRFYSNTLDIAAADSGGVGTTYSVKLTDIVGNYFADKNKATYVDFTTANGGAAGDQSGTLAQNGFASDTMTTTKIKAVGTAFTFMGNYDNVGIFDGSGLD